MKCQCLPFEVCAICTPPEEYAKHLKANEKAWARGRRRERAYRTTSAALCKEFEKELGEYQKRLTQIRDIILGVEQRCMAADGPVTPCHEEITDEELRKIYKLAGGKVRR